MARHYDPCIVAGDDEEAQAALLPAVLLHLRHHDRLCLVNPGDEALAAPDT